MNRILLKSPDLAIVNKPADCHSNEWYEGLLLDEKSNTSPKETCGALGFATWLPAHRLDFKTSGCLLVCSPQTVDNYTQLFRSHSQDIQKIYLADTGAALADQLLGSHEGFIVSRYRRSKSVRFLYGDDPILSRKWHSKQTVEHEIIPCPATKEELEILGLSPHTVGVRLLTGARHQIRAFFASHNMPITNDPIYGLAQDEESESGEDGLVVESDDGAHLTLGLHAWSLEFTDPISKEKIYATAKTR